MHVPPGPRPGRPARPRARGARVLGRRQGVPAHARAQRRRPGLGVLRGPADRQRPARRPPRRGPRLQGPVPALQDHERLRRPAQGRLGLPRPAGRARGREGARLRRQGRHRGVRRRRVQRAAAASRCCATSTRSRSSPPGWATGSTWPTRTGRWTRSTSTASGGRSSRSSSKGLLVEDHRITPYCPRCGTGLSDHELGQPGAYETVVDPSVYVRCPVTDGPLAELGAALLVWTTTPWTLVSNTAVAVHPDVTYVVARPAGQRRGARRRRAAGRRRASARGTRSLQTLPGRELAGTRYRRPFELVAVAGGRRRALRRRWPTTSRPRTGPGWCTSRRRSARRTCRSPASTACRCVNPVAPRRHVRAGASRWSAACSSRRPTRCWSATCDDARAALPARRVRARVPALLALPHAAHVLRAAVLVHPDDRAQGRAAARRTSGRDWYPDNVKWGRYGDWLRNNVDWALSRSRYWGTPLPLWRNDEDPANVVCVGLAGRARRAGRRRPRATSTRTGRSSTS